MIGTLKTFGLAFSAVMALAALAASAAQALPEFHSEIEPTTITMREDGAGKTGHQVIVAGKTTVTCTEVSAAATMAKKTAVTITTSKPVYNGCTFLGAGAFVSTNECSEVIHATSEFDIICPEGKEIEYGIKGVCVVSLGTQEGLVQPKLHNLINGEITVELELKGLRWKAVGAGCPEAGEGENGTLTTGNRIFTGEDPNTKVKTNIWWA